MSILQTILDLPGRNGLNLVLRAEYRSRDAKLFNEATRSTGLSNNYGQTVLAHYDVFDQNGYWLKTGGLLFPSGATIPAELQYEQERWVFNGYLFYSTGGSLATAGGLHNATEEKSKTLKGRHLLGAGWSGEQTAWAKAKNTPTTTWATGWPKPTNWATPSGRSTTP
ncbi:MAG: hypothetical protein ACOY35_01270 [Bacillota bacterium]